MPYPCVVRHAQAYTIFKLVGSDVVPSSVRPWLATAGDMWVKFKVAGRGLLFEMNNATMEYLEGMLAAALEKWTFHDNHEAAAIQRAIKAIQQVR